MSSAEVRPGLVALLQDDAVASAARTLRAAGDSPALESLLELGRALAHASGDHARERSLRAELTGYEGVGLDVPEERRVIGFASPFPVRAIGLLEPEEIFLANREKFSQVTLTIGQPVRELEMALAQIEQGGVLALKVPASEVSGEAVVTDLDVEVFIYILPREIERVITSAKEKALAALAVRLVDATLGDPKVDLEPTQKLNVSGPAAVDG